MQRKAAKLPKKLHQDTFLLEQDWVYVLGFTVWVLGFRVQKRNARFSLVKTPDVKF